MTTDEDVSEYFKLYIDQALKRFKRRLWAARGKKQYTLATPYMEATPYLDKKYIVLIWIEGASVKWEVRPHFKKLVEGKVIGSNSVH